MTKEPVSFWIGIVCAAISISLITLPFPTSPVGLDLSIAALAFAVVATWLLSLELWRELKRPELRMFRLLLTFTALLASFRVIAVSLEPRFQSNQAVPSDSQVRAA